MADLWTIDSGLWNCASGWARVEASLADVLDERDHVLTSIVTERFERRLTEECGKLRVEMGALRAEMRADFRVGLADQRADFIKWSFIFWIGQAVTVVGTVAGLLVAFR